jgi:hypothetical protein
MSEMALTADRLIVVGKGRLITEGTVDDVVGRGSTGHVRVATADPQSLHELLHDNGADVETRTDDTLIVTGMDARQVGIIAGTAGITCSIITRAVSLRRSRSTPGTPDLSESRVASLWSTRLTGRPGLSNPGAAFSSGDDCDRWSKPRSQAMRLMCLSAKCASQHPPRHELRLASLKGKQRSRQPPKTGRHTTTDVRTRSSSPTAGAEDRRPSPWQAR